MHMLEPPVACLLSLMRGFEMVMKKGVLRSTQLSVPWIRLWFLPVHLEDDARQQAEEELGEQWAAYEDCPRCLPWLLPVCYSCVPLTPSRWPRHLRKSVIGHLESMNSYVLTVIEFHELKPLYSWYGISMREVPIGYPKKQLHRQWHCGFQQFIPGSYPDLWKYIESTRQKRKI